MNSATAVSLIQAKSINSPYKEIVRLIEAQQKVVDAATKAVDFVSDSDCWGAIDELRQALLELEALE